MEWCTAHIDHHSAQVFNACDIVTAPHVLLPRIISPPASSLLSLPSSFPLLSLLPPPPLLSSSGHRWFNDVVIHSCSSRCLMVMWPKSAWQHGEQQSSSWAEAVSFKHTHKGRHWCLFTYSIMFTLLHLLMRFTGINDSYFRRSINWF